MGGKNKTHRTKCAVEECDKLGAYAMHCYTHWTTRVYRKRPEVRAKHHVMNRTARARYNRAKNWCERHGYEWVFSLEEFASLLQKGCFYCEADITQETGRGLDRLESRGPYSPNNVVPCCGRCNKVRGNIFSPEETLVMMRAIAEMKHAAKE